MNLIEILRDKIESLGVGSHVEGLRAVLQHVQVASAHLRRGVDASDETAFTDAIYRTNQAFEGSLKEAYRVLAEKDPKKARPYDIENFLQERSILRNRVLEQMTRYRTEWRNPSTHDYQLDFDEDEALLAIVSVCAFAVVLIDQIAEKISFERAKSFAHTQTDFPDIPLVDLVVRSLLSLDLHPFMSGASRPRVHAAQVAGAVAGHLVATLPSLAKVITEAYIGEDNLRADMVVECGAEKLIIEIKKTHFPKNIRGIAISQISRYIAASGIRDAVLFIFNDNLSVLEKTVHELPGIGAKVVVLAPGNKISES